MKKCNKCGNEFEGAFCNMCGAKFVNVNLNKLQASDSNDNKKTKLKHKKQLIIMVVIAVICFLLCICIWRVVGMINKGEEKNTSIDEVLSVSEIKNSEKVKEFFMNKGVTITEIKLGKRQINEDKKEDIVYVDIIAENENVKLAGKYVVMSKYYDVGGWQIENIQSDGVAVYSVKELPRFEIEVEGCVIDIIQVNEKEDNNYMVTYSRTYKGDVAEITETWQIQYNFDIYTGEWKKQSHTDEQIDYNAKISEVTGLYAYESALSDKHQQRFALKVTSGGVNNYIAHMNLYDYSEFDNEYKKYDLGYSKLEYDKTKNVYCFKFKHYQTFYIIIKADGIYVKYYNQYFGGYFDVSESSKVVTISEEDIKDNNEQEDDFVIPNVVGKTYAEAIEILMEEYGLEVVSTYYTSKEFDAGIVIKTEPKAPIRLKKGDKITVYVSLGGDEVLEVPDVIGKTEEVAKKILEEEGFFVEIEEVYSDTVSEGYVISMDREIGMCLPKGETITLRVSKGKF